MSEHQQPELDALVDADWDIPLTDEFVAGVRRGVRRRRLVRGAVSGGALAATAGVLTVVMSLAGGGTPAPIRPAGTPSASVTFIGKPLDGFGIGYLPAGVHAIPPDGTISYGVSRDRLLNEDRPAPKPGEPTAAVTMRVFRMGADKSMFMWISVLRPENTTPTVSRAQITGWLTGWAVTGTSLVETLDVPIGTAHIVANVGSEVTVYAAVVTTGDGAVIVVDGRAGLTVEELKKIAASITPAR